MRRLFKGWVFLVLVIVVSLLVAGALQGCGGEPDACEGVEGACMALYVGGSGPLLGIAVAAELRGGAVRQGQSLSTCERLPCLYRMRPPPGVAASQITALRVSAFPVGKPAVTTSAPIAGWADGAHIMFAVYVGGL